MIKRTLHNGTGEDISYDSRSRVSWILLKKPGPVTLRSHGYTYDDVSNVLTHAVGGVTTTYGYDNANQLTSESRSGYSCSYTYDANGNRATRTLNGTTETYTNDAADNLTSISVGGNTVRSFTYDYLGRRKTDTHSGATTTYTWDQESRIASIARTGMSTHTFRYNGLDTRTSKTVGSTTTSYLRNGAYVTDGVLKEVTGSTTTNHTPGISEKRGSASTQYLHSGLKNADARTSGQSVDSTRLYDAFGNIEGGSGTWNGPFGYAGGFGYQEDTDAGLKLLGHRYYDSATGRFMSKDPVEDGRNWYSYCENNPISSADADGLVWAAIAAAARALLRLLPRRLPKSLPKRIPQNIPKSAPKPKVQGPRIQPDKQGKHVPGHKNQQPGKAEFTHKDPQGLIDKFAGKGEPLNKFPKGGANYSEKVDFGEVIGNYVDPKTGKSVPTSKGMIIYDSKGGVHIVPLAP